MTLQRNTTYRLVQLKENPNTQQQRKKLTANWLVYKQFFTEHEKKMIIHATMEFQNIEIPLDCVPICNLAQTVITTFGSAWKSSAFCKQSSWKFSDARAFQTTPDKNASL